MTIEDIVERRQINEILHFTTNSGLTGILATKAIKSRKLLLTDQYLEHILKQNCPDRSLDAAWHNYVHLSISRINSYLFGIAEGNWHHNLDGWWCIVSINPAILSHEGVVFTTTNNIYPSVRRAKGTNGLEAMYAPVILGRYASRIVRNDTYPESAPTCPQAEVLYPEAVGAEYVQRIYVRDAEHAEAVHGICGALSIEPPVQCVLSHRHFT